MICRPSRPRRTTAPWQVRFLAMLPAIEAQARFAFRRLDPEAREDAIQETIANALVAFVGLVQREKTDVAYPTALVRFAVAQIHDGRRVGNRLNVRDVLSPYAQQQKRHPRRAVGPLRRGRQRMGRGRGGGPPDADSGSGGVPL